MKCDESTGYPKNWKELSLKIRERENNSCKFCGVKNHSFIRRKPKGEFEYLNEAETQALYKFRDASKKPLHKILKIAGATKIILTVAHLDRKLVDHSEENLAALCQRCHLSHDKRTPDWIAKKNSERRIVKIHWGD
jgi:5-methylcytosine-specific restriction endonuclease McrA